MLFRVNRAIHALLICFLLFQSAPSEESSPSGVSLLSEPWDFCRECHLYRIFLPQSSSIYGCFVALHLWHLAIRFRQSLTGFVVLHPQRWYSWTPCIPEMWLLNVLASWLKYQILSPTLSLVGKVCWVCQLRTLLFLTEKQYSNHF
jgi:hypothetical protein